VAVDPAGQIYVADTWNGRIQVFDAEGRFLRKWGVFATTNGELGDPNSLFGPRGIAIDLDGNLLVADTGNKRILRFSPTGETLGQIGGGGVIAGRFEEPTDVKVDPTDGTIVVADARRLKQMLVNLLPRFYDYTGGRVLLDGVELTEYPRHYLRSQIGIVEQEPFLFSRTVRDNITYGVTREVSDAEVEEAARAAAIHEVILSKLPHGYDTLVGERGITLSGGEVLQQPAYARRILRGAKELGVHTAIDTSGFLGRNADAGIGMQMDDAKRVLARAMDRRMDREARRIDVVRRRRDDVAL